MKLTTAAPIAAMLALCCSQAMAGGGWKIRATLEGHAEGVCSVAFSRDGKRLASLARGNEVRIWDAARGELVVAFKDDRPGAIECLALSPDGKLVATGDWRSGGEVSLRDATTGKLLGSLMGHEAKVRAVAFSPDGKLLACASMTDEVVLWDVGARKERARLRDRKNGSDGDAMAVAFSPDGRTLAVLHFPNEAVCLWDVGSTRLRGKTEKLPGMWVSLAFSPDSRWLATGVEIWDVATGKLARELDHPPLELPDQIAYSADGKTFLEYWKDRVVFRDVASGKVRSTLRPPEKLRDSPFAAFAVSADAKSFAWSTANRIQLWRAD